jgi:hypothetical protein
MIREAFVFSTEVYVIYLTFVFNNDFLKFAAILVGSLRVDSVDIEHIGARYKKLFLVDLVNILIFHSCLF